MAISWLGPLPVPMAHDGELGIGEDEGSTQISARLGPL